jgi:hypothetical protein
MITLELEKTAPDFQQAMRRAKGQLVVLTRNGRPAFAVVDVKDELAIEALSLSRQPEFMAYLDGIATGMRDRPEDNVTLNDLRQELDLPKFSPRRAQKAT